MNENMDEDNVEQNNVEYYETEFNFMRPYFVEVTPTSICVMISTTLDSLEMKDNKNKIRTIPIDDDPLENDYYIVVWESQQFEKLFIGYDECDKERTIGNTFLVYLGNCEYVFIGGRIMKFKSFSEIKSYHSPVGRDNIPFPYGVDGNFIVYFMYGDYIHSNKEDIENFTDFSVSEVPYYLEIEKRQGVHLKEFYNELSEKEMEEEPNKENNTEEIENDSNSHSECGECGEDCDCEDDFQAMGFDSIMVNGIEYSKENDFQEIISKKNLTPIIQVLKALEDESLTRFDYETIHSLI